MSFAAAVPAEDFAGTAIEQSAGRLRSGAWVGVVELLAAVQVALAMAAAALGLRHTSLRLATYAATLVAFSASAGILLFASRDRRAFALGMFYLLAATAFARPILYAARSLPPVLETPAWLLWHIRADSFAPYFFWLFILEFPRRRPFERFERAASRLASVAFAVGLTLCLLLVFVHVAGTTSPWTTVLIDPARADRLYWPILFVTMLPALPYAVWRTQRAAPDERRRARIIVAGLALGLAPDLLATLATAVLPSFAAFLVTPRGRILVLLTLNVPLLTVPFATAYAVLVQHALELRFFVRRGIRYALAKSTLTVLAALPLLSGAALLYARRDEPLATMLDDGTGTAIVLAAAAAFLTLRLRSRLLVQLDRRFFREQYDVRVILGALVERIRRVRGMAELQALLKEQIAAALHAGTVDLLLRGSASAAYVSADGRVRPLGSSASVVRRLDVLDLPLRIDWAWPKEWLRALPLDEQQWLIDAGHALLVPVRDADGALPGILALGEKRSELPYTRDDCMLLALVAKAVALALADPGMAAPTQAEVDQPARECPDCGRVHACATADCERCRSALSPAPLPLLLAGKFRLAERIGRGAMGVVYRARDLALERDVAIKTLPRTSAAEAARLRHEARAMAAVSDASLAAIYGVESWRGTPLLVEEYLPNGTLADRLARERLRVEEALDVAERLLRGLSRLHDAGILHRDIKPSNIGFSAEDQPKLLDFGIAGALSDPEAVAPGSFPASARRGTARRTLSTDATLPGGMIGTPFYLSPEAIRGEHADPSVDLWALCMVLYEAIAGRHPVEAAGSQYMLLLRLAEADFPDVRSFAPEVPPPVAALLRVELGRDPARRARSARVLGARLEQLRAGLLVAA